MNRSGVIGVAFFTACVAIASHFFDLSTYRPIDVFVFGGLVGLVTVRLQNIFE